MLKHCVPIMKTFLVAMTRHVMEMELAKRSLLIENAGERVDQLDYMRKNAGRLVSNNIMT